MNEKAQSIKNVLWREVEFVAVYIEGNSGGIMCLWDGTKLKVRLIVSSSSLYSILFTPMGSKEVFIINNVYAPTTLVGRKILWSTLKQMHEAFLEIS